MNSTFPFLALHPSRWPAYLQTPLSLILIIACLLLIAWPCRTRAEDLAQIYELALQQDPQLKQAEANRLAAQELSPQALAKLLPTLAITGALNQSRFNTSSTFTEAQIGVQNFWDSSLYLKLIQPIYHNDHWVNLAQAENQVAQAEAEYAAEEQALLVRSAKAYFDVLLAEEKLESARAEKQAFQQQLAQVQKRFEAGFATTMNVNEAQSGFDLANANEIAEQRNMRVAKAALRELIGDAPIQPLKRLHEELPLQLPTPAALQDWKTMALQNNLSIIAAQNQAEVARKGIELQFSGHLPTLDLVGSVGVADTNRPAGLVADSQSIGLQLNVPVYQGGAVNSRVRQAQQQLNAALANLDKQRRTVDRQIEDAFYGIEFSISRVNALKTALKSSSANAQATENAMRAGMRTVVDVIAAQRDFYRAQRDYAAARYEFILNGLLLKQGVGALTREDLKVINGWLRETRTD